MFTSLEPLSSFSLSYFEEMLTHIKNIFKKNYVLYFFLKIFLILLFLLLHLFILFTFIY